jgi:polyhydroxybutyrate depolymerase
LSGKRVLYGLLLLILMFGASSASAQDDDSEAGLWQKFTLEHGGMIRNYNLYVPSSYDTDGDAMPLVMAFHPSGGDAVGMARITGYNDFAEADGVIVAYLEGPFGYWDYGYGTENWEPVDDVLDDPGYVRAVFEALIEAYHIDETRVYAVGYSNGARMAFRMGCEMGDQLAAIGAVSATISDEITTHCPEESRVSVIYMHGTRDTVTPFEGKPLFIGDLFIANALSAPATAEFWAGLNGCDPSERVVVENPFEETGNVILSHFVDCELGTEVAFYAVENGNHAWFNGAGLQASEAMWAFFMSHARMDDSAGTDDE